MAKMQATTYSLEALEDKYQDIVALYDHAEELLATVESRFVKDAEAQLAIVEPLIADLGDAADTLSEEFVLVAETLKGKKSKAKASKSRIESALRKIYNALREYQGRVYDAGKKAHGALQNIADPIVEKIRKQTEKILAFFMETLPISLANLMNKAEAEALRAHNSRIAFIMHQHALGQQS